MGCGITLCACADFILLSFSKQWHFIRNGISFFQNCFRRFYCLSFHDFYPVSISNHVSLALTFSQMAWLWFAFIYMDDERDAEDAIRAIDRREFGKQGRRLRVEWTKQERGGRRSVSSRRSLANSKPSKTLFVINFDPINTRTRDLERHFEPHGKVANVRIRRNFAFIQFETLEDAAKALEATNMSKLIDRVITVEYAVRDDDDNVDGRRNGYSPNRRGREHSPSNRRGREYDRDRSPSPYGRGLERDSPDYGRGASPFQQHHEGSPRKDRAGSPGYERYRKRSHGSEE